MEAGSQGIIQIVVIILAIVAIYQLYKYLYGGITNRTITLIQGNKNANVDPSTPVSIPQSSLPSLHEGGEFTVSFWMYVNNWNYRAGRNKHIISIGGYSKSSYDTIRIYLGANKNTLKVRLHTHGADKTPQGTQSTLGISSNATSISTVPAAGDTVNTERLDKANQANMFTQLQMDGGLDDGSSMCDLPEIDMQRWVHITVAVSGRTVDVYMDGKLARSCVLPSFYKVDPSGYTATLLGYGGFGGLIANATMSDYAHSPDEIYRNYMQGPESVGDFLDYLKSFFVAPK
jgi:hypothetical protein